MSRNSPLHSVSTGQKLSRGWQIDCGNKPDCLPIYRKDAAAATAAAAVRKDDVTWWRSRDAIRRAEWREVVTWSATESSAKPCHTDGRWLLSYILSFRAGVRPIRTSSRATSDTVSRLTGANKLVRLAALTSYYIHRATQFRWFVFDLLVRNRHVDGYSAVLNENPHACVVVLNLCAWSALETFSATKFASRSYSNKNSTLFSFHVWSLCG